MSNKERIARNSFRVLRNTFSASYIDTLYRAVRNTIKLVTEEQDGKGYSGRHLSYTNSMIHSGFFKIPFRRNRPIGLILFSPQLMVRLLYV